MRTTVATALLLLVGCAVPEVTFYDASDDVAADAARHADAAQDAATDGGGPTVDSGNAVDSGSGVDAGNQADAGADALQAQDAPYDGYCHGNPPPPAGGKCCGPGNAGAPCFGDCNAQGCAACGTCTSPEICCTMGVQGSCMSTCGP